MKNIGYYEKTINIISSKSEDKIPEYLSNIFFFCMKLVGFMDDNEKVNIYFNKIIQIFLKNNFNNIIFKLITYSINFNTF